MAILCDYLTAGFKEKQVSIEIQRQCYDHDEQTEDNACDGSHVRSGIEFECKCRIRQPEPAISPIPEIEGIQIPT